MNLDITQHQTHITVPDDSSKVVREALPPAAQFKVVIPGPTDQQPGLLPNGMTTARHRGRLYGMPLAWRGLHLLGATFGIAAVWYVAAWIIHGRQPMTQPISKLSIGTPPSPILPPDWLLAVLGLLALVSIFMMLLGTQDANPMMKFRKGKKPNHTPDGIRQPADGSPKPSV